MPHNPPQATGKLEKAVYTGYYISQDRIVCQEDGEVTPWFIGRGERIISSSFSRTSGDYRIERGKIKVGRRNTGFYIQFEEEKQKIYGPSSHLPWM